jgi:hypothetical protein
MSGRRSSGDGLARLSKQEPARRAGRSRRDRRRSKMTKDELIEALRAA